MQKLREKGFTLLELLAVLVILTTLSLIAIPIFSSKSYDAKLMAHKNNVELLSKQAQAYLFNSSVPLPVEEDDDLMGALITNGYLRERVVYPFTGEKYIITADNQGIVTVTPGMTMYPIADGETPHDTVVPSGYTGIYSIEDLYAIRNNVSGGSIVGNYILMKDLDFSQDSSYEDPTGTTFGNANGDGSTQGLKQELTEGAGWLPIGAIGTPYIGKLNGNNYKINKLFINRTLDVQGLFGIIDSQSEITNIGLESINVNGASYVGGLVGGQLNGIIKNCYAKGIVTGTGSDIYSTGGLIGTKDAGSIIDCYTIVNVTGDTYVGGIVGANSGTVINCYSSGNVTSEDYAGGLVGKIISGNVSNCYATGLVNGNSIIGGLVGYNIGNINNCYATGNVTGTGSDIGGLVGSQESNITKCYATGTVTGGVCVGGLLGWQYLGSVTSSYALGVVNGESHLGGLTGGQDDGEISDCYSKGNVIGTVDVIGGFSGRLTAGSITNCYSIGNATGGNCVGGLIGYQDNGTVSYSFVIGNVSSTNYVGGLIGVRSAGTTIRSYRLNTQTVTGTTKCTVETGTATLTDLQGLTPQSVTLPWNTTTLWQKVSGSWPILR